MAHERGPERENNDGERDAEKSYTPLADIFDGDKAFSLLVDLPGTDEHSVEVEVGEGQLTLTGRASDPLAELSREHPPSHQEFSPRTFRRIFAFPDHIDVDKIDVTMKNGVASITLPKLERTIPRKIIPRRED